ncbi:MAG: flavodoxin family protein [Clostridiales bacterium]|jgi:multimeric flavodoxin WrbA|nr:flavodoxin family protein [Clostridiales bacterium]
MYTVILNGSPRKNGDTVKLLNMIIPKIRGDYKIINTFFSNISPCTDCRKCHTSDSCSINDNMAVFFNDLKSADNIIISSPLHYSMLSGNLLSFMSRFQYIFVSKNIRKDPNFYMKKKKGYLILTGGGATKDFYPAEKISKLVLRELNASLDGVFKYIDTDKFPLKDFNYFEEEKKLFIHNEIEKFTNKVNTP